MDNPRVKRQRAEKFEKIKRAEETTVLQEERAELEELAALEEEIASPEVDEDAITEPLQPIINNQSARVDNFINALVKSITDRHYTSDLMNEAKSLGLEDTQDEHFWDNAAGLVDILHVAQARGLSLKMQ